MQAILRRVCALLVCLALLVSLFGCGIQRAENTATTDLTTEYDPAQIRYNDLRLPYARADSLDPFLAKSTMNRQLTSLLYDGLFTLDEHFSPVPWIAKEYTTDSYSVLVTINSDVRFTDGSLLTADDVLYSFAQAKESAAYKSHLSNFDTASLRDADSILFTLFDVDPYAVACLDFPIIKSGTSSKDRKAAAEELTESDEDRPAKSTDQVLPVGSGRYVLRYVESESDPILTAFNDRYKGFFPAMSTIHLVNVTDSSALFYSLEIGNISFAFDDLSSGKYTRVNATISEYPMNAFVFLGMNQDDPAIAQPVIRHVIREAINLEDVLNVAFQGHATLTNTPFNPLWSPATDYESTYSAQRQDALAMLKEAGFDQINTYGIRNNGRISLSLDLIVSEDNEFKQMAAQQIAKKLGALKIKVNIKTLPPDAFVDAVQLGKFDLYIGEVNLSPNMPLDVFFGGSGTLAHGIWSKTAADAYHAFLAGEISFDAFMEAFELDMPFIPLCYRKGIVASVKELQGTQEAGYADLYADIERWRF